MIATRLFKQRHYNGALRDHRVLIERYLEEFEKNMDAYIEFLDDTIYVQFVRWRRYLHWIDTENMIFSYQYMFVDGPDEIIYNTFTEIKVRVRGEFVGSVAQREGCPHCRHLPCRFKRFSIETLPQRKVMSDYGRPESVIRDALTKRAVSELFGTASPSHNPILPECFLDGIRSMDVPPELWFGGWPEDPTEEAFPLY